MIARLAAFLVTAAAAVSLLVVLGLMTIRVPYPYEIEWMEGAMVDHVSRVADGQALYVPPSIEFVPFLYPPLFYVVSAAVSSVTGGGFLGLRLVSALSSIGILVLIAAMVWRETGKRDAALVGAGLFAAMFKIGGSWFDVGRVDMFVLLLVCGVFFTARYGSRRWTFLVTGALVGAAFLTKQTAAIMVAPVVAWMLVARPAQGAGTALVGVVIAGGGTLLLDAWHDGWYRYYLFELPSNYAMHPDRMVRFFIEDLMPVTVASGLGLLALLTGGDWRIRGFRAAMALGLVAAALISRSNDGGYNNVLLPAFAAVSVMAAIGFDTLRRTLAAGAADSSAMAAVWPSLLLLVQFGVLAYNPLASLPSPRSEAVGDQIVARLRESPGDVWVPYHGYLATKAGKQSYANWMAVSDILRYGPDELRAPLAREVSAALAERRFSLVVMSNNAFRFPASLQETYERSAPTIEDTTVFMPLTGSLRRPAWYYVPRAAAAGSNPAHMPAPATRGISTPP